MRPHLSRNGSADRRDALAAGSPLRKSALRAALLVRRERWTLTWTGRLLVTMVVVTLTLVLGRGLFAFLAVNSPVGGQYLIVEGWMPSFTYREAAARFRQGGYRKVIAAGVLDWDEVGERREHFGGDKLVKFGVPERFVVTTSADDVQQDRTFHAAQAVKRWLEVQGLRPAAIDVVTVGAHARRSRLLYQRVLGHDVEVGVVALEDRRFDQDHWWRSSVGVRTVLGETIAYLYAKIIFSVPRSSEVHVSR
jgi:hypothetical protein